MIKWKSIYNWSFRNNSMPAWIPIINKSLYKHSQNSLHLSHPDFPKERQRWRGRTHCCPHVRRRWTNYRVQMELTDSLRFQIEAYVRNPKTLNIGMFWTVCIYKYVINISLNCARRRKIFCLHHTDRRSLLSSTHTNVHLRMKKRAFPSGRSSWLRILLLLHLLFLTCTL